MSKLLAIAASYRSESLNRQLLAVAAQLAEDAGAEVTIAEYASFEAPLYRGTSKDETLPPAMAQLSEMIAAHDGLLIAMPEHNWSIPASLKNLIDWLSIDSAKPLNGKIALLMCASPSTRGGVIGLQQLRTPLEVLGVWVHPQLIGIGKANTQLNENGLVRAADSKHLETTVRDFVRATKALAGS